MKEIKRTRTIEEVTGYEAVDGTIFNDKEECIKYDKSARAVAFCGFKNCVVGIITGCDLFLDNGCDDDTNYIVYAKNAEELNAVNLYINIQGGKLLSADYIGKETVVYADYDGCIYGHQTIEQIFDEMKKRYDSAKEKYNAEN